MRGICGYIQKNNIDNTDTINNMISSQNILTKNNIAFGVSPNLSILNLDNYIIAFDGEIYNKNVIKNVLITRGYTFEDDTDIQLISKMYIEFKEKILNFINGIFSLAIYDIQNNSLFISKDRLGIKPLFYSHINDTFIFSSQIKGILNSNFVSAVMGKDEILELIALGPAHTPGKTYFKDIFELEAGHYAIFKDNKLTINKYWDLKEKKLLDSDEEIILNSKELVIDSVKKQISGTNKMASMLSGGLDSSIITKIISDNVSKLNTYSINYEDNDKDFTANSYQLTKDSDFVKIMNKHVPTNHKNIIIQNNDLFNYLYSAVIARDMPGMADIDTSMLMFCNEISKNNEKIILSGECSDEIFGGYPWYYKENLKSAKGFPWALSENLRENLLNKKLIDKHEILEYIVDSKTNTLKDIKHISLDPFENEFKDLNYLTIKYFMNTLIERTDRMSSLSNLTVRVPFADYRIFEYVYNVDAKLKLGLRNSSIVNEKYILKQAFKNDLPIEITQRKKSPFPKTYSNRYLELLENKLLEIVNNPSSRIQEIIDTEFVKHLIETHGKDVTENLFGQLMTYPQTLAYLIQIDYWLNAYNVKITLN